MPDPVTPALTPEEWSSPRCAFGTSPKMGIFTTGRLDGDQLVLTLHPDEALKRQTRAYPAGRHALAALCLYQQTFGFTREDIQLLDNLYEDADESIAWHRRSELHELAARIAALLPPEEDAP